MTIRSRRLWMRANEMLLGSVLALAACAGQIDSSADPAVEVASAEQELTLAKKLPPELAVPKGNYWAFYRKGVGVQIYTCTAAETGYSWVLTAPEADLLFPGKHVAGSHYAGPTWEALDGSTVVASRVAGVTVDATAVPWLLLQAVSHSGTGLMSKVTYIQRIHTTGGLAPTAGCGADTVGATVEIDYTADYLFYYALPAWLVRFTR